MKNITNTKKFRRHLWYRITAALLVSALLGYLWYDYRFPSWKEEVKLPNNRTVIVKQRRDFVEGYGTRKTWLTFSLPEMGEEQTWSAHMQPILLTIGPDKAVYVVGWPSGFKQSSMYNLPRYGYTAFKWTGKHFERVPFISIPEQLRKEENIVRCMPQASFITLETKRSFGCDENSNYVRGASNQINLGKDEAMGRRKRSS